MGPQDDDGFVLYESRAICRYLAEKYAGQGTPLIPTGLKETAVFEQAASIELASFLPVVKKVAQESLWKQCVASLHWLRGMLSALGTGTAASPLTRPPS